MATLEMNVRQVNSDFQAIKDKIVEHGVEVADGTRTAEYASKVDDVFEAGKKAEWDVFWDVFQNYGNEVGMSYSEGFGKNRFTDANYNPKYPIQVSEGTNSGYAMFNGAANISDTKVPIYHRGTNCGYLFASCGRLIRIPALHILAKVSSFASAFAGCNVLETLNVYGEIPVNIDIHWSARLSHDSVVSIINALSTTVSGQTLTLSATAVNNAFETSEGAADGSTSTEWTTLIGTKTNWTISLV